MESLAFAIKDQIWVKSGPGTVFSYKLRYIVGFWLVEIDISTNPKPTIYRNLYENTGPDSNWYSHVACFIQRTTRAIAKTCFT